jgi:hypothetical protein
MVVKASNLPWLLYSKSLTLCIKYNHNPKAERSKSRSKNKLHAKRHPKHRKCPIQLTFEVPLPILEKAKSGHLESREA